MAKNIIKARIKQRSDSAANWAADNPVLLKGELGLVDDDPNLYKVGDGKTAWNDLPLRGFDGTVAQETGDSSAAVMSQAAVTRALEAANEKIEDRVPKETGKGLSSNDFTDAEKEKLAALENYDDAEVKEALSTLAKADTELAGAIGKKVDKVDGKQLTTEDFTTALKDKLQGLNNYDDAEVKAAIEKLRGDFDTLVGGDTSAAIKSFNDIVAFLEGIEDSESLDSIIASIEQQIAGKQDEISDLETIRQGAAKGATALQVVPEEYVTQNLLNYKLSGAIFSVKRIAWADLVFLKGSSTLIPGQFYRITDYVTTTTQENTQSAGHRFDVIVLALDSHTLSEEAYACHNEDDSYFADAGANLAAWKIWYCLDNDKERFAWADEENGKGVIYRMIDERDNDCPYDFKNIMFIRYELEAPEAIDYEPWLVQMSANIQQQFDNNALSFIWSGVDKEEKPWEDSYEELLSIPTGNTKAFYTFSILEDGGNVIDASLSLDCYHNLIKASEGLLNNIVFFGTSEMHSFHSNVFGHHCSNNSFGYSSIGNSFGHSCSNNVFGNRCSNNSFGYSSIGNSFGHGCIANNLGSNEFYHSFGDSCSYNSLKDSCYSCSLGNDCKDNIFGGSCEYNLFGDNCFANNLEYECEGNILGNRCSRNRLGNNCKFNNLGEYVISMYLDSGVSDITLLNREGAINKVQYYHITSGVTGELILEEGRDYKTTIAKKSSGEIVQFNTADLF